MKNKSGPLKLKSLCTLTRKSAYSRIIIRDRSYFMEEADAIFDLKGWWGAGRGCSKT